VRAIGTAFLYRGFKAFLIVFAFTALASSYEISMSLWKGLGNLHF